MDSETRQENANLYAGLDLLKQNINTNLDLLSRLIDIVAGMEKRIQALEAHTCRCEVVLGGQAILPCSTEPAGLTPEESTENIVAEYLGHYKDNGRTSDFDDDEPDSTYDWS